MSEPTLKVRGYQKGDLEQMNLRWMFISDKSVASRTDNLSQDPNVHAHTITRDDIPIAVLGGTILWEGVAELWSMSSPEIEHLPIFYCKIAMQMIRTYAQNFNIRRFQCAVRCDFDRGRKWIEYLGFKPEGIMKGYGPDGSDHFMYGRVS